MPKTRKTKSQSSQSNSLSPNQAHRVGDLHKELVAQNINKFDAIKYSAEWLKKRFPTVSVIHLSETELVLTTEWGFEVHSKFDPKKSILKNYFMTPDMILTKRDRPEETWILDGVKAIRYRGIRTDVKSVDLILYWWFVTLNDFNEDGWPIEGITSKDLTTRVA